MVDYGLKDKVVIITGANNPQGIGATTAIAFAREGAKDILLMNWQAHPTLTGGLKKPDVSADYIGVIRDIMEEQTDSLFAFFQGASGNLTCASKIVGETITRNHKIYGGILAEWSMLLYKDLQPVEGDKVSLLCHYCEKITDSKHIF